MRRGRFWAVVAGSVVATASMTVAASTAIEAPARVGDRAQRLNSAVEQEVSPEERAVVELLAAVNAERTARGLPPLSVDPQVSVAARAHAADMAANQQMQHAGSDGSDGGVRLERAGYVWLAWGENIGAGFIDPQTLVDTWMQSPPHRMNLLGDFVDVGVGVVASADGVPYWALVAGRRSVPNSR